MLPEDRDEWCEGCERRCVGRTLRGRAGLDLEDSERADSDQKTMVEPWIKHRLLRVCYQSGPSGDLGPPLSCMVKGDEKPGNGGIKTVGGPGVVDWTGRVTVIGPVWRV